MQKHCHRCRKHHTRLRRCRYCGEYFCDEHLPAKMCLTRRYLDDKSLPIHIRIELEKEWRKEGGHPDAEYTSQRWKGFYKKDELPKSPTIPKPQIQEQPRVPQEFPLEEPVGKPYELPSSHQKTHFKFPSNRLIIFLIIAAAVAYFAFFAPQETKSNLSAYLEGIKNNISSSFEGTKNNIAQAVSANTASAFQTTEETICISQINDGLIVLKAKIPSNSIVSIVNQKRFLPMDDINSWIKSWSSIATYVSNVPINCQTDNEMYICKDLINIVGDNKTLAIGVAVKIDFTSAGKYPTLLPLLCDRNGNLMSNSKSYIIT